MKLYGWQLRNIISENLLAEAKCPGCGDDRAYIGLNAVECPNPDCRFASDEMIAQTQQSESDPVPCADCGKVMDVTELNGEFLCPNCGANQPNSCLHDDISDGHCQNCGEPVGAGTWCGNCGTDDPWQKFPGRPEECGACGADRATHEEN
jgi:predicted RNA-binding Zn-ribbon protein involved in translation (DUF1610 family)